MSSILVTSQHLRAAKTQHGGYCTRGGDLWFRRHGLDLRHFLREGYAVEVIEATGDEFGLRVAAVARQENKGQ